MKNNPLLRGLKHRRSDAPHFAWLGLYGLARGRVRFGGRMFKLALAAIALSGCATTKYTTVYCLSHDQALPNEPERIKDKLTGQADKDLAIVAGSAIRLRAWGEGLKTILNGCRDPGK